MLLAKTKADFMLKLFYVKRIKNKTAVTLWSKTSLLLNWVTNLQRQNLKWNV